MRRTACNGQGQPEQLMELPVSDDFPICTSGFGEDINKNLIPDVGSIYERPCRKAQIKMQLSARKLLLSVRR
jgi:hypothetical protein